MSERFCQVQKAFVKAVKEPSSFSTADEDTKRRMKVYQSLFFNNIAGFISSGFPVLQGILNEEDFRCLIRQFFVQHSSRSPYFVEIAKEFVEFLSSQPDLPFTLPAYALELAHYEWLELDIGIRKTNQAVCFYQPGCDIPSLVMSPLATLASYAYEVHLIGEDFAPDAPAQEQQFYVVYRDSNHEVQFLHLNAVTALLLDTIEKYEAGVTVEVLTEQMHQQLPHIPHATLVSGLQQTITELLLKGVLVPSN